MKLNCKVLSNFEGKDSKKRSLVIVHTGCENTYLIFWNSFMFSKASFLLRMFCVMLFFAFVPISKLRHSYSCITSVISNNKRRVTFLNILHDILLIAKTNVSQITLEIRIQKHCHMIFLYQNLHSKIYVFLEGYYFFQVLCFECTMGLWYNWFIVWYGIMRRQSSSNNEEIKCSILEYRRNFTNPHIQSLFYPTLSWKGD